MESLGITENKLLLNPVSDEDFDVEKCIKKFESHPSIISIKRHVKIDVRFGYRPVTEEEMDELIASLDPKRMEDAFPLNY